VLAKYWETLIENVSVKRVKISGLWYTSLLIIQEKKPNPVQSISVNGANEIYKN